MKKMSKETTIVLGFFSMLHDLEIKYAKHLKRDVKRSESDFLFVNFLRMKLGLDPIENLKGRKGVNK